MILAHAIVGVTLGNYFGHWEYYLAGSIIPDIDHLAVLGSRGIFSFKDMVDSMRFEKKYGLNFKTKYGYSLFGAITFSLPVFLFDLRSGWAFFIGYIIHLLLDWPDIDEKYYFCPLRKKFSGFLPIFSRIEIIFTIIMFFLMLVSFKNII